MTKQELLIAVYPLLWDESIAAGNLDSLHKIQDIVTNEVIEEASKGNIRIKQWPNGFPHEIEGIEIYPRRQ
jgi:hypothetical protein